MSSLIEPRPDLFPKSPFNRTNLLIVFITAMLAGVAAILSVQRFLALPSRYDDFTVGETSWASSTKLQDLVSLPAFVAGFILAGWVMYRFFSNLSNIGGRDYEAEVTRQLSWWLLPFAAGLGGMLSPNPTDLLFMFPLGIVGILTLLLLAGANMWHRSVPAEELTWGMIAVFFLSLLPAAVNALAGNISAGFALPGFGQGLKTMLLLHLAVASSMAWVVWKRPDAYRKRLPELVTVSQAGLALFYSLLIPNVFLSEGMQRAIHVSEWLPATAVAFGVTTLLDLRRRWLRFRRRGKDGGVAGLFSPWAVFTLVLLLKAGQSLPPMIPNDDQRFGESLLGWWSLREFGMIPHIDFQTRHGIFGDHFTGLLSWLFLDGTAGTLPEANRLAMVLVSLVAFFSLIRMTGRLFLSLAAVLFFATNHYLQSTLNFLLLAPFISALLGFPPQNDSNRWLKSWPVLGCFLVLLSPTLGIALMLASLPAAFHHATLWKRVRVERYKWVMMALFAAGFSLTPLPRMIAGAVRHAWEEWDVFHIAFGTEWTAGYAELPATGPDLLGMFLLDFFRMSWAWVFMLAIATVLLVFRRPEYRRYLWHVGLPTTLLILMLSGHAMGRIEPMSASAAGTLSSFSLSILLPLLVSPWLGGHRVFYPTLAIVFLSAGIGNHSIGTQGVKGAFDRRMGKVEADAASLGLFNIGRATIDPAHADRLARVNKVLRRHLAYREPYLDLTGNQAHYIYFDRPPAMSSPSHVHLVTPGRQAREVERLTARPPKLILLEADNPFTSQGRVALRSHLLYRFVVGRYRAELHDGYVFALPDSLGRSTGGLSFILAQRTDSAWENGMHRSGTGIVVGDSLTAVFLKPGDAIVLPDGSRNKVRSLSATERIVWLQSPIKDRKAMELRTPVVAELDSLRRRELSEILMKRAFTHDDLGQVPVTWGLSYESLEKRMSKVLPLDFSEAEVRGLTREGGWFMSTGGSASLELRLKDSGIAGIKAGLLYMEFGCERAVPHDCLFQVGWWTGNRKIQDEKAYLTFKARSGRLIIPLDSHPDWLLADRIEGIRIELPDNVPCKRFRISNASLQQRMMATDPAREP